MFDIGLQWSLLLIAIIPTLFFPQLVCLQLIVWQATHALLKIDQSLLKVPACLFIVAEQDRQDFLNRTVE
ncbi:hypothetical protein Pla144_41490 [Bythopirellula polymerisocia]|uniref:Uncharacterized protein n=1 Tax=Bythopirellula polymerisocia TaxID=2528003 RepID=A0A5C6CIV3_9BACT|nr:hypothetical protein Pla144_41490 [Bythopirellula polymerisocia]